MSGLLIARNNTQMVKQEEAEAEQGEQRVRLESSLSAHVLDVWAVNKRAKLEIEQKFLRNLRQRNGVYEPDKMALILLSKGSEVFMKLTEVKCRACESWVGDVYSPAYEKDGFSLKPTPNPEMPAYVLEKIHNSVLDAVTNMATAYVRETRRPISKEEFNSVAQKYYIQLHEYETKLITKAAEEAAKKMHRKIKDQMHDGGYAKAFEEVRRDTVTFGTGFMKGPVIRKRDTLTWQQTETGYVPAMTPTLVFEYSRVSPFDMYPSPTATSISDGDLIERLRVRRSDINALVGVAGYNDANIRLALNDYAGGLSSTLSVDSARDTAEGRSTTSLMDRDTIEMLSYWGKVQGRKLLEYGMTPEQIPDPDLDYAVHIKMVGEYVIKAVKNITGIVPYSKCVYTQIPGSFWGDGLPDDIEDLQTIVNAIARAIANNAAMASGPQVELNASKMKAGADATTLVPWKIWLTDEEGIQAAPVVKFYQPKAILNELMNIYDRFSAEADVKTGIPSIAHGGAKMGGSVGATASGLSMYLEMSGKVIREFIGRLDRDIVYTVVTRTHTLNMLFDADMSIKGDAKVVVGGVNAMSMQEQQTLRKQEFLTATNNPNDVQIMGLEGRRYVLREAAQALNMDVDKAVPLDRDLLAIQEQLDRLAMSATEEEGSGGTQPTAPEGATTDVAGNPSGGVDVNMFNSVSQRGGQ